MYGTRRIGSHAAPNHVLHTPCSFDQALRQHHNQMDAELEAPS